MAKVKEIKLVYQDCPMCGSRKKWGKAQTEIANTHGLKIVKTPFTSDGARDLIMEAVANHGIKSLPFFTDGKKFSKTLEDFVAGTGAKSRKTRRAMKKAGKNSEQSEERAQSDVSGEDT